MRQVSRPASEGGRQLLRPLAFEERIYLAAVGEAGDNAPGRNRWSSRPEEKSDDLLHRFLTGKASRAESCAVVRILLHLRARSLARKAR